jgi:transcriptional regulator with XRE-family HTH domain
MTEDAGELDREYGKRMKKLREERGLTQADVVRRMKDGGVSYMNASTLSRIESGLRPLRLSEADVLSGIYTFPLSMLTFREPTFERVAKTIRTLDDLASKLSDLRNLSSEIAAAQLALPGLANGLDLVYENARDQDLVTQLDRLKKRMQRFAALDLVGEVVEMKELAEQQHTRSMKRVRGLEVNDGEHQTEA